MDILVGIHCGSDFNEVNAAKVSLDETLINRIHILSRRAGTGTISEFCNVPELGMSDLDLENSPPMDMSKITEISSKAMFEAKEDVRTEIVELHVDKTDFWWEGVYKHTDIHWETRMIPLSILPKPTAKKVESGSHDQLIRLASIPDLNMTVEQMNAIHEKIAQGMNHGLNAREIDRTFNRHVTKAQLIRCIMELIERGQ
jgi:hypothetical protein